MDGIVRAAVDGARGFLAAPHGNLQPRALQVDELSARLRPLSALRPIVQQAKYLAVMRRTGQNRLDLIDRPGFHALPIRQFTPGEKHALKREVPVEHEEVRALSIVDGTNLPLRTKHAGGVIARHSDRRLGGNAKRERNAEDSKEVVCRSGKGIRRVHKARNRPVYHDLLTPEHIFAPRHAAAGERIAD
ncbi:hypothetical protein SDC9_167780 [bioreactor metagenome]|uniref:Uncharacterized protein n=1 Tax=bioreactor metagenome TaxID=1076179 RepID=A0A645G0P8_9ZZZZ